MKRIAAVLIVALSPTVAFAQSPPWISTDLTQIKSGPFALDKSHAKIIFSTTHFGFSTYYGLFTEFDAKLGFDAKAPTNSTLEVSINLDGIDTTNPKMDGHLKSPDFFDVAKYPNASFKATKIEVTGATSGKIIGDLTLHGVTKPVTLDASFNGGGVNPLSKAYVLGFNATGTFKRSEFGMTTYLPAVGDDIKLVISAEFDQVQ